jgi:hypothetical protein
MTPYPKCVLEYLNHARRWVAIKISTIFELLTIYLDAIVDYSAFLAASIHLVFQISELHPFPHISLGASKHLGPLQF